MEEVRREMERVEAGNDVLRQMLSTKLSGHILNGRWIGPETERSWIEGQLRLNYTILEEYRRCLVL